MAERVAAFEAPVSTPLAGGLLTVDRGIDGASSLWESDVSESESEVSMTTLRWLGVDLEERGVLVTWSADLFGRRLVPLVSIVPVLGVAS